MELKFSDFGKKLCKSLNQNSSLPPSLYSVTIFVAIFRRKNTP